MIMSKRLLIVIFFSIICLTSLLYADHSMTVPDSSDVEVIKLSKPVFPSNLKLKTQTVKVLLLIDENGGFEVLNMPDHAQNIEEYLIAALETSQFKPAMSKKKNVKAEIVVEFYIEGSTKTILKSLLKKEEKIEPSVLKSHIEDYIVEDSKILDKSYYHNFFYSTNIFQKGLLYQTQIVRKNNIISYNNVKNNNLTYQNDILLYQFEKPNDISNIYSSSLPNKKGYTNLQNSIYKQSVFLLSTDMGMGENDISFAKVKAQKNHLFNVENLSFHTTFLGYQGDIPLIKESAANSNACINYNLRNISLQIGVETINQDYSSKRLNNSYFALENEDLINEKGSELWLFGAYKYLYFGMNRQHDNFGVSTGKKIDNKSHSHIIGIRSIEEIWKTEFDLYLQQTKQDFDIVLSNEKMFKDNKSYLGLNILQKHKRLILKSDLIYDTEESNYHTFNRFDYFITQYYSIGLSLLKNSLEYKYDEMRYVDQKEKQETAICMNVYTKYNELELFVGKRNTKQNINASYDKSIEEKYPFLTIQNSAFITYAPYTLRIRHMLEYQNSELLYYTSQLLNKTQVSIEKDFSRDNVVSIGLDTYYADQMITEQKVWDSSFIIDVFAKVQITKFFELVVKAHNITDTEYYLAEELNLLQYSGNIRWNFLN